MNDSVKAVSLDGRSRNAWVQYGLAVLAPAVAALLLAHYVAPAEVAVTHAAHGAGAHASTSMWAHLQQPLPRFLFQLLVILCAAKLAGVVLRRLGQPAVIGEMAAGILLGPLLLGQFAPEFQGALFASTGLQSLGLIGQLGVLVFLFVSGAEIDPSTIKGGRRASLLISHAGIALPFLLGVVLALAIHAEHAPAGTSVTHFALFIGVTLSITAFPVLLRILHDRRMASSGVGQLATTSAALADASAWVLLVLIAASAGGDDWQGVAMRIAGLGVLAIVMLGVVRPRIATLQLEDKHAGTCLVGLVLFALTLALATELLGVHALFGAFLAGVTVSGNAVCRHLLQGRLEPFAAALLLPIFFASTGFKLTPEALVLDDMLLCAVVVAIATFGKVAPTWIAARWAGLDHPSALRMAALMNTRGLMELVVATLGLELGLIDQRLFVVLVVMALVTTAMTGPLLSLIDRRYGKLADARQTDVA